MSNYSLFNRKNESPVGLRFKSMFRLVGSILMCICLSVNLLVGQSLPCHAQLNVSLNAKCEYVVRSGAVLSGSGSSSLSGSGTFAGYTIMLTDHYNTPIEGTTITSDHLGQTLTVKIVDNGTSNSCWGSILVEDKAPPSIACEDDPIDVYCLNMDSYLPEVIDNCDQDAFATQVGQMIEISDCTTGDYVKTIKATYVASDNNGYTSDACTQTIRIEKIDTLDIVIPTNWTGDNSFVCNSDFLTDNDGHPHPDTTGIPYIKISTTDSVFLWPAITDICKARMDYVDTALGKEGCRTKIFRTWTFYDVCTDFDEYFTRTQEIWIEDKEAPIVTCKDQITVEGNALPSLHGHGNSFGGADCKLEVNIPPIVATDNCTEIRRFEILVDGNFVLNKNGGVATLSAGTHEIKYIVFDGCNKSDTCTSELIVVDKSAPLALCDKYMVIGLTSDGNVQIEASRFDNGSLDDCGIDSIAVARMAAPLCDTFDIDFGPAVTFCCSDIGTGNLVTLRVWDSGGRYNDCMTDVEIQDKTRPNTQCPLDTEINCEVPYNLNDLSQFGVANINNECSTELEELDPIADLNSCNNGTITRNWAIKGSNGSTVCSQVITIKNPNLLSLANLRSLVTEPKDVDTTGACGINLDPDQLPEGFQRPTITSGVCDLLGATYKDETFQLIDTTGACIKILRTWTILNWCATDDDAKSFTITQSIKVTDNQGPEVELAEENLAEYCTSFNNCTDHSIVFEATGFDNCTPELRTSFIVDLNNDGLLDDTLSTSLAIVDGVTIARIERVYPIGSHRVQFVFIDGCGKRTVRDHLFTVKNCKAPSPKLDGRSVNLQLMDTNGDNIPDTPMACLWASDFNEGSEANCNLSATSFYLDKTETEQNLCLTCNDLGTSNIEIFVFDEFGNFASAITTVLVSDHDNLCGNNIDNDIDLGTISGKIINQHGSTVEEAKVSLLNSEYPFSMTNQEGDYAFASVATNHDYSLSIAKNDDYMNGVSTLDLVLIQKHILGVKLLDNPYDMIAADINASGNISGLDLVQLRKLILGDIDELPTNTSWRFIDQSYKFNNEQNPFSENFSEGYDIDNLNTDMKINFIGLKVGDVNGTSKSNNLSVTEIRNSREPLRFKTRTVINKADNLVAMEFSSDNFNHVTGFQTTFEFANEDLEFVGLESVLIEISQENVSKKYLSKGKLPISWNTPAGISSSDGDILFKIYFKKLGAKVGAISNSSAITQTEAYVNDEIVGDIIIINELDNGIELKQNYPNPWNSDTEIVFNIDNSETVYLNVYDLFGRLVHTQSNVALKGKNKFQLDRTNISNSGIYLYEIITDYKKVVNKMIVID